MAHSMAKGFELRVRYSPPPKDIPGFFPTPDVIIVRMTKLSELTLSSVKWAICVRATS